jgi:tRNA threonylcarbamoyladenosine modification (KEOPS) complex  Pcc1 subunit
MELSASLFVKCNPDMLYDCLVPEQSVPDSRSSFDRSSFIINKEKEGVRFSIKAKDAVALRATFNTITQLLIIFESAEETKKQQKTNE